MMLMAASYISFALRVCVCARARTRVRRVRVKAFSACVRTGVNVRASTQARGGYIAHAEVT